MEVSSLRKAIRPVLGLVLSIISIGLVVRLIDGQALADALARADFRFIPPAIALYFLSAWLRSTRFKRLLGLGAGSESTVFQIFIIGLTVNNLLPFRLGEVTRTYLTGKWLGVPIGTSVAALIIERILDGVTLALFLAGGVLLIPNAPAYLLGLGTTLAAGFGLCALVMIVASWRPSVVVTLARWLIRPLPARFGARILSLTQSFMQGVIQIRGIQALAVVGTWSVLAWAAELGLFAMLFPAFHIELSMPVAFVTGAAGTLATLIPSSPGYVGTFHGAVIKVLADVLGTNITDATAYAIVVHATLFIPVVVAGLLFSWRRNISLQQVTRQGASVPGMSIPQTSLVSSE